MPLYTYRDEDGNEVLLVMSVAEKEMKEVNGVIAHEDGRALVRDIMADARGVGGPAKQWAGGEMVSHAVGCHPSQRKEMMATLAAQGVPTYIDKEGGVHMRSRKHRSAVCKAMGVKDLDAGYGDYSGS